MGSRIIFIVIISLVCISIAGTAIFINRFTKEEFQEIPSIPPPLPELPEKTVQSVFYYPPEIYRDPFKVPIRIKPLEEVVKAEVPKQETSQEISAPGEEVSPAVIPVQKAQPVAESKPETVQTEGKVPVVTKTEEEKIQQKISLPKVIVTGIIYDDEPFAILEFEGKSGIFEKGDKLSGDLSVKKIYADSVDIAWKGRVYNIKLGGKYEN